MQGNFKITPNNTRYLTITNKQKWVKLSGFVWVDNVGVKSEDGDDRNDLFKTNQDDNDLLLDKITVRVMDRTTGDVAKDKNGGPLQKITDYVNDPNTKQQGHGSYFFKDVETDKLKDYYIEFEYDGLTYQNVLPYNDPKVQSVPNYSPNNASKAAENTRNEFNENFGVVKGDSINSGHTEKQQGQGQRVYGLEYNKDEDKHTATLKSNGNYEIKGNDYIEQTDLGSYPIKSNTEAAGYTLGLRRWI